MFPIPDAPSPYAPGDIHALLAAEFPQIGIGQAFQIEATAWQFARVRMRFAPHMLRPGGTVSGPAIFTLADIAMYVAVLAAIGPVPLAVTTSLTINFLQKPAARDMIGDARLLKLGKRLAVGEIALYSDGETSLAAHATATYSVPPRTGS
jgi:uncharacterized protein (TIGR00369 family)